MKKTNLEEVIHEGFQHIAAKLGDESKLKEALHDELHQISEKFGKQPKVENTPHAGFVDKIVEKSSIDKTLHDGFHGISEKLEHISSHVLEEIIVSLDKAQKAIVNLPASFGSSRRLRYKSR